MHCAAVLTWSPPPCRVSGVPEPHGLHSVWPLQASIHICLLLTMGITESRLDAKKATIYLKTWTHPQAGAAKLPPPRGVRHYLTSVDPGPTASTDTHPSSWRMWRSAHMHIYEYIYRYFCLFSYVNTCDGEKHSADNLPPPTAITWLKLKNH